MFSLAKLPNYHPLRLLKDDPHLPLSFFLSNIIIFNVKQQHTLDSLFLGKKVFKGPKPKKRLRNVGDDDGELRRVE